MISVFSTILDWSEVWATFLPVLVWLFIKPKHKILKPVIGYLFCALVLCILIDLGNLGVFQNNNIFYNILSVVRLFMFIWFFNVLNILPNKKIKKIIITIVAIILLLIFLFENISSFNSAIFSIEGLLLIIFCILYFLKRLKSDESSIEFDSALYIVTGLAIYEAVCFPIFLFYDTLIKQTENFAVNIWDVHNIAYIVFCLFIARAFYGSNFRRSTN